jgi:glutamate-1-semialdehyde 2,1-aminomutase
LRFNPLRSIDEKISELIIKLEAEYTKKTRRSRELYEESTRYMPAGVTYALRYMSPYPLYIERAQGTRLIDVDGNEYIDFWMGHGSQILGHLHPVVVSAVKSTLEIGFHLGLEHSYSIEYAEFLTRIIPGVEMVRFTNSGTEANMYATRLARAYTGRKYIVKVEGGWHGGYDDLHKAVTYPYTKPESSGLLEESTAYTLTVPFNDPRALEDVLRKYEVAAFIVEPVMGAGGCIEPNPGYLREVRRLTEQYGALLIFDEVITGFRLAPGGAQEYFGVKADVVVFGKAISGGVSSAGVVASRAEIMELMDHLKRPDPSTRVFHGGTYVASVLSVVVGYAVAKYLVENKYLYDEANRLWSEFRRRVQRACEESSVECWTTGTGSLSGLHFTAKRPRSARDAYEARWSRVVERALHLYSRVHGAVYMSERMPHYLPSLVHSKEEVEKLVDITVSFIEEVKRLTSTY